MSRFRCAIASACLAIVLFAALPGAATAQRGAELDSVSAQSESVGNRLVGATLDWGRAALTWLQALFAAEHGGVVPAPTTPPIPSP